MKCLVVDDSSLTRRILVNSLRGMGFKEIVEAADSEAALALCTPELRLIITDWNMPGMSGVDLVRRIRRDPALAAIPVILVSARHVGEDMAEAARAGVSACVVKPFTPDVLSRKVHEVLQAAGHGPAAGGAAERATGTDG